MVKQISLNSFEIASDKVTDKVYHKVYNKLNKTQEKMLTMMRDNSNITAQKISRQLNLSEPAIKKNLRILKSCNVIERVGSNKKGYWNVLNK